MQRAERIDLSFGAALSALRLPEELMHGHQPALPVWFQGYPKR